MPRQIIPLSARKIEVTKPTDNVQRLFDGGGLYLEIPPQRYAPDGKPLPAARYWRLKFRFAGKEYRMALGMYPSVTLEKARVLRQEVKDKVAAGINPSEERREKKAVAVQEKKEAENTVEWVTRQWLRVAETEWADGYARTVKLRLERDVLPMLGDRPIAEVTSADILAVLRRIEDRGVIETAHRVKTIIGQLFSFAIITSVPGVTNNPASGLAKALKHAQPKSMAAILDPATLGMLLRACDQYPASFIVRCALQLAPLLFVRPGELRHAEWAEFDLDKAEWNIPMEKMKLTLKEKARRKGEVHTVPLAQQAVDILKELYPYTRRSKFVFAGRDSSRPMSENTVNVALRTMGWDKDVVTGHGFRATARTMLHERLGFSPDAIEAQLAHRVPDRLGTAYNRAKHLTERTRMMQEWADYLDQLRAGQ
ncbi:MAG: integrase arm-type DNA-binding domain-containing protein [Chlorobiaceae bacterium]